MRSEAAFDRRDQGAACSEAHGSCPQSRLFCPHLSHPVCFFCAVVFFFFFYVHLSPLHPPRIVVRRIPPPHVEHFLVAVTLTRWKPTRFETGSTSVALARAVITTLQATLPPCKKSDVTIRSVFSFATKAVLRLVSTILCSFTIHPRRTSTLVSVPLLLGPCTRTALLPL